MSGLETFFALIGAWLFIVVTIAAVAIAVALVVYAVIRHVHTKEEVTVSPFRPAPVVQCNRPVVTEELKPKNTPALKVADIARFQPPTDEKKHVQPILPEVQISYWLLINHERSGPFTLEKLKADLQTKKLLPSTLCRDETSSDWVTLASLLQPLCIVCKLEPVQVEGQTCEKCGRFQPG